MECIENRKFYYHLPSRILFRLILYSTNNALSRLGGQPISHQIYYSTLNFLDINFKAITYYIVKKMFQI